MYSTFKYRHTKPKTESRNTVTFSLQISVNNPTFTHNSRKIHQKDFLFPNLFRYFADYSITPINVINYAEKAETCRFSTM